MTTLGKLFTPICLDADSLRYCTESLNRVHLGLHFVQLIISDTDALPLLAPSRVFWTDAELGTLAYAATSASA